MVYIFGYGSLIDTVCRQCTFPAEQAFAARLNGFRRFWSILPGQSEHTALAVCAQPNESVNGVLIPFDANYFDQLDLREAGYQRLLVDAAQIECLDSQAIDGSVYVYVVEQVREPSPQAPILQTYLDICLHGCLAISEGFAREFIDSTGHWGWCHNDRLAPRYPRARELGEAARSKIDGLLASVATLQAL